jgi:histidyl-tRNA synthetase
VLGLAARLRQQGFVIDVSFTGNMKKRMNRADKIKARAAVIIGGDEARGGTAAVRDLTTGEQRTVPQHALETALAAFAP